MKIFRWCLPPDRTNVSPEFHSNLQNQGENGRACRPAACSDCGRYELYKKFRQFEMTRRLRREMRGLIPRLHDQQITKLSKVSERKRWELFLETETMKKMTQTTSIEQIQRLREQAEKYSVAVKQESSRLNDIEKGIKHAEELLVQCRRQCGGKDAELKKSRDAERRTRNHENLLDKALVKFNEASNSTKQLKETIDFLRRERQVFDSVQDKMLREIREKSSATKAMLAKGDAYGRETDEYQNQMRQMKDGVDQEFKQLERGWHEIASQMMDESEDLDDIEAKHTKDMQVTARLQLNQADKEIELSQRTEKAEYQIQVLKDAIRDARNQIHQFENHAVQVCQATNMDSIDTLVASFLKVEEENFNLYKWMSTLQQNIESAEDEICDIEGEIAAFTERSAEEHQPETGTEKLIRDLSRKERARAQDADEYQVIASNAQTTLTSMCQRVAQLFPKLGVKASRLGMEEVTDLTINESLAVIEEEVVRLLDKRGRVGNAGVLIRAIAHEELVITPPAVEDESDDDEGPTGVSDTRMS